MDISVIIVNYNVKHFLEQCLHSVKTASKNLAVEIFVVDNNSVDGSMRMVAQKFPDVTAIQNKKNTGFSKANNQAIRQAKGKYVLLLNPDTVIQENTLQACFDFMEKKPEAGALSVKMIDGRGRYLPESKRGLPTPKVAFYKIFGLTSLFPRSKTFGKYYLGHLSENESREIEVLPGAFMFMRAKALEKSGLLDESFFMYGEDIDLSYRIIKSGYKNYYLPETTIIHYKGESTKKGSINYVMVFYQAMIIFAQKHFSGKNARFYILIIRLAIYFRAGLSLLKRFITSVTIPVMDAMLGYALLELLAPWWELYHFGKPDYYPPVYQLYIIPAYILIWILFIFILKGYKKPYSPSRTIRGILSGTGVILIIYALLPEQWRFSRALIIIGTGGMILLTVLVRFIFYFFKSENFPVQFKKSQKRIIIIADETEAERIQELLSQTNISSQVIGFIHPDDNKKPEKAIGTIDQVTEIIRIYKINEIIFGSATINAEAIMKHMLELTGRKIEFKIAPPESLSIIGSNSINTAGELYTVSIDSIGKKINRRKKRMVDLVLALVIIVVGGFMAPFSYHGKNLLNKAFQVLKGKKTWIGYIRHDPELHSLPPLREGILEVHHLGNLRKISPQQASKLNIMYAKDYRASKDLTGTIFNLKKLFLQ